LQSPNPGSHRSTTHRSPTQLDDAFGSMQISGHPAGPESTRIGPESRRPPTPGVESSRGAPSIRTPPSKPPPGPGDVPPPSAHATTASAPPSSSSVRRPTGRS
jgi:hypothetical protein